MNAVKTDPYAHLRTEIDRREQWGQRWNAWQAQLMHRYAKRISKRHKNPEFSIKEAK